MNKNKEKLAVQYAMKIKLHISDMFKYESENYINFDEFENSENATAFLHALANIVPAMMYNQMTNSQLNFLEFNHVANQLCFDFMKEEVSNG